MIVVLGHLTVDPSQREAFLSYVRELVPEEQGKPGCIAFGIYQDVTAPNGFLMLEQWQSQEALDEHTSTSTFAENEAKLSSYLADEPNFKEYEV